MPNLDDFLSVTQAADLLKVTPRAVRHRILAGALPATKVGAGRTSSYVIRREDVEALIEAASA